MEVALSLRVQFEPHNYSNIYIREKDSCLPCTIHNSPPASFALRPPPASSSIFDPPVSPALADRCRHPERTGCFENLVDLCSCNSYLNEKSQEVRESDLWKEIVSYMGPAPPINIHRYMFALFQQRGGQPVSGKFDCRCPLQFQYPQFCCTKQAGPPCSPSLF
ncbi:hypothetical protein NE237_010767 [Protea cynaroides]|uniref:Uncharacterized protein n=1 Tax=Protea cynaroides TaxID=273540 RepID=A0A9Q0KZZ6_9MAGN|nr:hypothetical protein NE237_010767 [Protea cynaroides]